MKENYLYDFYVFNQRTFSLYYQNQPYQYSALSKFGIFWCYQLLVVLDMFTLEHI